MRGVLEQVGDVAAERPCKRIDVIGACVVDVLLTLLVLLQGAYRHARRAGQLALAEASDKTPGLQVRLRMRLGAQLVEAVAELAYIHFVIRRVERSDVVDADTLVNCFESISACPLVKGECPAGPVFR